MNKEFVELYEKHIRYARVIDQNNMEAFVRCCYILFAVDICRSCSSTIATYYGRMKEFYDKQLARGFNPNIDLKPEVIVEAPKKAATKKSNNK